MIVGVDAGATTAIAVLSLSGEVVALESRKHWNRGEVAQKIAEYSPAVIACDTNPTSDFARELKAAFGARLVFPKKSMSVWRKEKMASRTGVKLGNKHERDALAAALKAFHLLENKLRQTAKRARGRPAEKVEAAQRKVLRGKKMFEAVRE